MNARKIGKRLLFPPLVVRILLIPVAILLLVGSMVFLGERSPVACASYAVAAYTLTVWCLRIPDLVLFFKRIKSENEYVRRWRNDARLRSGITLFGSSAWNAVYGLFQLWLGFYHHTFWFASLGVYYLCLAVMRLYLVGYLRRNSLGEQATEEWKRYRTCGWVLLVLNVSLSLIIFFMVYWNRTFEHHMITAIAMASYTFLTFTTAVVNLIKYRRYNSPVLSAGKAITMAAACVSMLTLESTMLTTFNDGSLTLSARRVMLGTTGAAVSAFVLATAVYMILKGTRHLKERNEGEKTNGEHG